MTKKEKYKKLDYWTKYLNNLQRFLTANMIEYRFNGSYREVPVVNMRFLEQTEKNQIMREMKRVEDIITKLN